MTQALDRKTGDLRGNARLCNNTNTIIIVPVLSRMPSSPPQRTTVSLSLITGGGEPAQRGWVKCHIARWGELNQTESQSPLRG